MKYLITTILIGFLAGGTTMAETNSGPIEVNQRKNRVTLHAGAGQQGIANVSKDNTKAVIETNYEVIAGIGYQRLVTDRMSLGFSIFTNMTGAMNIGYDF